MRTMVEQGMKEDGAFGLSSGLFYVPGTFSSTDEVIELAKVAARFGGIYISHTCATRRPESSTVSTKRLQSGSLVVFQLNSRITRSLERETD
jgi:hypothetical protein